MSKKRIDPDRYVDPSIDDTIEREHPLEKAQREARERGMKKSEPHIPSERHVFAGSGHTMQWSFDTTMKHLLSSKRHKAIRKRIIKMIKLKGRSRTRPFINNSPFKHEILAIVGDLL